MSWLHSMPARWELRSPKALFEERRTPNYTDDVHLTPSQKYGVLPQAEYVERTGGSVVLNLSGQDKMKHVEEDDFIIHLRSFQGGLERARQSGKVSSAYTVIEPKLLADPGYYGWVLKSSAYIQELQTTTNQLRDGQSIRWSDFIKVSLPNPPLGEQEDIADFLDRETRRIDELIAEQRGLIETLRGRRQAVVRRATTLGIDESIGFVDSGVKWLGPIRADAQLTRVRFLADVNTGHGDTQDSNPDGAYPFYVRSEGIEKSNNFDYIGPAVLTSGDGAGVGKVFHHVADSRFMAHQRVYVIDNFRNVDSRYFFYAFSAHFAMVALDGSARSTVDSVRRHMITNFPVVVPSIDRQLRVVEYLDDQTSRIDELISESEDLIALSHERRAALITAAVTGQIDVRSAA